MTTEERNWQVWLGDHPGTPVPDEVAALLDAALAAGPERRRMIDAVERLKERMDAEQAPIYYDVVRDTPVGTLFLAVGPRGLVRVGIGGREAAFLRPLRRVSPAQVLREPDKVRPAADQVREYFDGRRSRFELQLDLSSVSPFGREVLTAAAAIRKGEVTTYGALAQAIGRPGAARAVGRALGANPVPLVIPCHRVIAGDGSLGGYSASGGVATKRQLLQLEGVQLPGSNLR